MVFFLATLHPNLPEYNSPTYRGPWLSKDEQKNLVNVFYREGRYIPLSFEHVNCRKYGFIGQPDTIGKVVDLFIAKDGNLMVKCVLNDDHPASLKIQKDVIENKIRWGVSVGLAQLQNEEDTASSIKDLSHVAFTTDPGFAEHNTYLHYWNLKEGPIDSVIEKLYYKKNDGQSYASEQLQKKIHGMLYFI
jgi:hypothetical protein